MSKRGGLGRGLSALIPGAPEAGEAASGLMEVPVNAVAPNPKQPRTRFDARRRTLAASIGGQDATAIVVRRARTVGTG
jgi:ParB family chromosome partitioning protein